MLKHAVHKLHKTWTLLTSHGGTRPRIPENSSAHAVWFTDGVYIVHRSACVNSQNIEVWTVENPHLANKVMQRTCETTLKLTFKSSWRRPSIAPFQNMERCMKAWLEAQNGYFQHLLWPSCVRYETEFLRYWLHFAGCFVQEIILKFLYKS